MRYLKSLFIFFFLITSFCFADDVTERLGEGVVNWSEGYIEVLGNGAPPLDVNNKAQARLMAERAALVVAYRNLVEAVNGVRVNSESTINNYVVESDKIKTGIEGFVQGAAIIPNEKTGENYTYLSDGSIRVKLRVPINGNDSLAEFVMPEVMESEGVDEPKKMKKVRKLKPGAVTGIVFDASEFDLKPAMSPHVYDENGKEVYGTQFVTRRFAIEKGVAGYVKGVDNIESDTRTGDNPLVIQAIEVDGSVATDIIISSKDAKKIKKLKNKDNLFSECKINIVLK
ncbi:hypothetical protein ACFL4A_03705 [bacterium]